MRRTALTIALLLPVVWGCTGRDALSRREVSQGEAGGQDGGAQDDAVVCAAGTRALVLQPLRIEPGAGLVVYPPMPCSWFYEWSNGQGGINVRVVVVRDGAVVADVMRACPGDDSLAVACLEPGRYELAAVAQLGGPEEPWMRATGKSLLGGVFEIDDCTTDPDGYLCAPVAIEFGQDQPDVVPLDLSCDEELAKLWGDTCDGK